MTKQMDPETSQRSLLFEVDYPEIEENLQPRHRFMSAYEQRVEAPDKEWQYYVGMAHDLLMQQRSKGRHGSPHTADARH